MAERVADARIDRRLGAEDDQAEALVLREIDQPHHVSGADADVARHASGASVAWGAVDALDKVGLHAFPHERVLSRTGPDDEDLHCGA